LLYTQGGIYFADGNGVDRIPVAGGSIEIVASESATLILLGANTRFLFVYDGSIIGSIPLPSGDGAGPKPLIATALDTAGPDGHFAADDDSIYWASNGTANTCHASNCAGTQKTLPKRSADSIWDVAIDDTAVYLFAQSGVNGDNTAVCTVWKLPK
jgi:hypothetical protein